MNGYAPIDEFEFPPDRTWSASVGGAIYCHGSSPTIKQCVISDNVAETEYYASKYGLGGGIFISGGDPVITDCNITGNSAGSSGGGLCSTAGEPTIADCTVYKNTLADGGVGGGIYVTGGAISRCTVIGNSRYGGDSSTREGGGVFATGGDIIIEDCVISNNYVLGRHGGDWRRTGYCSEGGTVYGGGISVSSTSDDPIEIRNCVLSGNTAWGGTGGVCGTRTSTGPGMDGGSAYGGAIYGIGNAIIIRNCTIADNIAKGGDGGKVNCPVSPPACDRTPGRNGKGYGGATCLRTTAGLIHNSILSNNTAQFGREVAALSRDYYATQVTTSYCDIDGGEVAIYTDEDPSFYSSRGNIDADPCFADPGHWEDPYNTPTDVRDDIWVDGDYHLKSQAGRWEPNEGRWVIDEMTSLCIDAGDPMSPIMHEPFPNGGIINMGTYGGTAEASKSYFGGPVCETIVAGDVNGDCLIDFKDFYFVALHWMEDHNP
jgi:hypothetical protein